MLKLFWDEENGGLFLYGSDSEQLILRPKEIYDGAIPSGNSVSALNFLRLARLTGRHELEEKSEQIFRTFGSGVKHSPRSCSFLMTAFLFSHVPTKEVVIVTNKTSDDTDPMIKAIRAKYRPFVSSLLHTGKESDLAALAPFIKDYKPAGDKPTAYVCSNFSCHSPINDVGQLEKLLDDA